MLSSIHPLGERARGNRWWITVTAFTAGSTAAGAAVGAILGGLGGSLGWREDLRLLLIGGLALVAGGLDLAGVAAPGPERQVNERWIGTFRGWVYGLGFGVQLGTGTSTFVVTWGVWAMFAAEVAAGSAWAGALVGGIFGFGRALAPLAAGWIDRPSRLTSFHTRMAALARPSHLLAGSAIAGLGALSVISGL